MKKGKEESLLNKGKEGKVYYLTNFPIFKWYEKSNKISFFRSKDFFNEISRDMLYSVDSPIFQRYLIQTKAASISRKFADQRYGLRGGERGKEGREGKEGEREGRGEGGGRGKGREE